MTEFFPTLIQTFSLKSELASKFGRLHFLSGDLGLADTVRGAHLLHGRDVFGLEVDEALVEALDLRLDHKVGHGELKVGGGRVDQSFSVHVCLTLLITLLLLTNWVHPLIYDQSINQTKKANKQITSDLLQSQY